MRLYKLIKDIYIPDFQPFVYIKSIDSLVAADLHLGIEGALEKEGIFLPLNLSLKIIEELKRVIEDLNPERMIFLGDVKHEFGFPNPAEWVNVRNMIEWLKRRKIKVDVVRGNHDNYLIAILRKYEIPLHQEILSMGRYSFTHGHLPIEFEKLSDIVLMGHEHPSIRIRDESGISHKFKCFLLGEYDKRKLMVLPSVNELATGTDVNLADKDDLLSPILREVDLGEFIPYPICIGSSVRKFPKLKFLKRLARP